MNGPLTGITVLEVSPGIAGSITGMLLADLGAEVWTVPPEDTSFVPADRAAGALRWGRGKRVVADAERSDLSRLLDRLGGRLDVCVDCTPTRDLHRALRHRVPRAVWARVVPSDDISLWSDGLESAELLAAAGGLSEAQSRHDPGPVDFPTPHCLYIQGMWSAA